MCNQTTNKLDSSRQKVNLPYREIVSQSRNVYILRFFQFLCYFHHDFLSLKNLTCYVAHLSNISRATCQNKAEKQKGRQGCRDIAVSPVISLYQSLLLSFTGLPLKVDYQTRGKRSTRITARASGRAESVISLKISRFTLLFSPAFLARIPCQFC